MKSGRSFSHIAVPLAWAGLVGTSGATLALAAGSARPVKKPAAPARPVAATRQPVASPATAGPGKLGSVNVALSGPWHREYRLDAGEAVEISVHLDRPSTLPQNGRVSAEWTLNRPGRITDVVRPEAETPRKVDAEGIYTKPTANWRKVLHALDGDVYLVYRAPVAGTYRLALAPVTEEAPVGATLARWREKGTAPELFPVPSSTPWPAKAVAPVTVSVTPYDLGTEDQVQKTATLVEAEPNDTPEQAQSLTLVAPDGKAADGRSAEVKTYEITGTTDDIEFFDNGKSGQSGDDWFRVELKGNEPQLVTAELGIPGQWLAARVRCYALAPGANPKVPLGALLPVTEHFGKVNPQRLPWQEGKQVQVAEGQDPNERAHQQDEQHRTEINRILEPGKTYYFRVEANAPGYQLQLRVLKPSPFNTPSLAIRQSMYSHIGQVDAWLSNRPRGASVERRIRDTGNLLGTQCMSCHTQSGIWGPAVAIKNGYRVENVQNFRRMFDVMYECLRPTNELKDAANNTSLAPLDIGDGPAGTRAAGFNIVNAEGLVAPKKLHGKQQIRTANYVLLTADPSGINAAGPGSNVGQAIVWLFSAEILNTAWQRTGEPRYFRAMEDRARKLLVLDPKFTDDVAVRLDFFGRVFPLKDYPAQAKKAADAETAAGGQPKGNPDEAAAFVEKVQAQLNADEARLRAIQNADGTWGFNPGSSRDGGKTWRAANTDSDPAPTALAISGLNAVGFGKSDPSIAKGVQALLRNQDPDGRWNKAAITGFVTTAYAIRALANLYPQTNRVPGPGSFRPQPGEGTLEAVKRVQAAALTADPQFTSILLQAAKHPNTTVRWWAMVGLGYGHQPEAVPALMAALKERAKPVREAATWALKQTLLDDHGWPAVLAAAEKGDDYTREAVLQALNMRADAVMPQSKVDWDRLTATFDRAMNDDPHPAVRAWASKAAWQWWIWNPPVRQAVNASWVRLMERPEQNALVEHTTRYSSQALFVANGHKANGSSQHQYKELGTLFDTLRGRMEKADPITKSLMARRLVGVAGTFYQTAGGDGGPGQMGYTTPGAGALFGQAVVVYLREAQPTGEKKAILAGLEGAANVPHGPLQEYLIDYTLKAPEDLRQAAAAAISDPRSAMLQAATELVGPLIDQVKRGANEPSRRASLSDPVIKLFGAVNWVIPKDEEQQRHFFDLIIPRFDAYYSPQQMSSESDAGRRGEMERQMNASWYLADKLGEVLASNPDLRQEIVFRKYFPGTFKNPLEQHFWIRSVPWLLEFKHAMPTVTPAANERADAGRPVVALEQAQPVQPGKQPLQPQKVDQGLVVKDQALQLFLDALKPDALPQTRAAAVRSSNATSVRRNPEVLKALRDLLTWEKDEQLRKVAENVVKQGSDRFVPELVDALKAEKKPGAWLSADGKVNPKFLEDFTYFRDYVVPELVRVKRNDQMACTGCHGIPGRVPSLFLRPADEYGYQSVSDLLFNYRESQARINLKDLDRSKMLRKPLNIQDGQEDGHQGGRRWLPQDEGYLVLKGWVHNQPKILAEVTSASASIPPIPDIHGRRSAALPAVRTWEPMARVWEPDWSPMGMPSQPRRTSPIPAAGHPARAGTPMVSATDPAMDPMMDPALKIWDPDWTPAIKPPTPDGMATRPGLG